MGIFDFLKRDDPSTITVDRPRDALKIATKCHKEGDYDSAINVIRKAYVLIEDHDDLPPTVAERLRLPRYLQDAGRRDESWSELNKLLLTTKAHREILPMNHSDIYTAMRIHCQKEGNHIEAIRSEVMSIYSYMLGLHRQKRTDEITEYSTIDNIEGMFERILKKAKMVSISPRLCEVMQRGVRGLPKTKMTDLLRDVDGILKEVK